MVSSHTKVSFHRMIFWTNFIPNLDFGQHKMGSFGLIFYLFLRNNHDFIQFCHEKWDFCVGFHLFYAFFSQVSLILSYLIHSCQPPGSNRYQISIHYIYLNALCLLINELSLACLMFGLSEYLYWFAYKVIVNIKYLFYMKWNRHIEGENVTLVSSFILCTLWCLFYFIHTIHILQRVEFDMF